MTGHDEIPPRALQRVGEQIAEHAGLKPPDWVLASRLGDRIAALGLDTPDAYVELITASSGARELELLVETLRVGETRFFRHGSHVKALTDVVVPALLDRRARSGAPRLRRRVRAWSAGCATGEEPYTLAMVLRRMLPRATFDVEVLASDLSSDALAAARGAVYPAAALQPVPRSWREWAFEPARRAQGGDCWRVVDSIVELVRFERRNLAEGSFPSGYDIIWCRNVLIYFTPEARERVINALIDSLAPGGFLFVGYAESLRDFTEVEAVRTPDAVLYRKAEKRTAPARNRPVAPTARAMRPDSAPLVPATADVPLPARNPAVRAEEAFVQLCGRYEADDRLAAELGAAISGPYTRVVVDLDGAEYLGAEAAQVVRRARSAALAAGIDFSIAAERPGARRWLTRNGLAEEEVER
jgi:chemotaxis protein methyltransferase CheR